jgi:hypothetical protein
VSKLERTFYRVFRILSGEIILTQPRRRANGGTLIFVRSLWVTFILYSGAIIISEMLDPNKEWSFSMISLQLAIKNSVTWFAAIFAGVYAALYARFASQWAYLAGLYNDIKTTEARVLPEERNSEVLIDLKAGFIEDADELHLALKPMYAAIIKSWASNDVRNLFIKYSPGGEERFDQLLKEVNDVLTAYGGSFKPRPTNKTDTTNPRLLLEFLRNWHLFKVTLDDYLKSNSQHQTFADKLKAMQTEEIISDQELRQIQSFDALERIILTKDTVGINPSFPAKIKEYTLRVKNKLIS